MVQSIEDFCRKARKPVIVLAASFSGVADVFTFLFPLLQEKGFEVAMALAPHLGYYGCGGIPVFEYNINCMKRVEQKVLVIGQDSPMNLPPQVKYLALPHAFLQVPVDHPNPCIYSGYGFSSLYHDYLFLPQANLFSFDSNDLSPVLGGQFPMEMFKRGMDDFTIIPGGYPKIDWLRKQVVLKNIEPDAILYAPTPYTKHVCDPVRDGKSIISTLLSAAPGYRVIYRPFPADARGEVARHICEAFGDDQRFEFDQDPSTLHSMACSVFLVTDVSLTALTFSLALGRPHINCDMRESGKLESHDFGYSVRNSEQLVDALDMILKDTEGMQVKVKRNRKGYLINDGNTFEYLADCAGMILNGQHDSGWIKIQRRSAPQTLNEPKDVARLLQKAQYWYDHGFVLRYAIEKFPKSRWLARYFRAWEEVNRLQPAAFALDYDQQKLGMLSKKEALASLAQEDESCSYMVYGCGGGYHVRWATLVLDHPEGCLGFLDGLEDNWGRRKDGFLICSPQILLEYKPQLVLIATNMVTSVLAALMQQFSE